MAFGLINTIDGVKTSFLYNADYNKQTINRLLFFKNYDYF